MSKKMRGLKKPCERLMNTKKKLDKLSDEDFRDGFEMKSVLMDLQDEITTQKKHHELIKEWMNDIASVCKDNIGEIEYILTHNSSPFNRN